MATTVNVTVLATDQNNDPVDGATVTAKLSHADVDSTYGYILPEEVSGTTNASGQVVLALWPNELGSTESYYVFKISNPDTGKVQRINATIPNANCNLHAVAELPPYSASTVTSPLNAVLASIASLSTAADKVLYFSGANTAALANFTAAGRALVDDADAAAQRTTLGLGNVDNTSDANKPISMATQAALDAKQPLDAELTAIAGLTSAANKLPYFTGSGTAALADLTAAGRALLDDADVTAQLATLGISAQTGSASVGHIASGTGAEATTVREKLRELVSIFDFLTDEEKEAVKNRTITTSVRAAINSAIVASYGKRLVFPDGLYPIDDQIYPGGDIAGHVFLDLEPGAEIKAMATFPSTNTKMILLENTTPGSGCRVRIEGGKWNGRNMPGSSVGQAKDVLCVGGEGISRVIIHKAEFETNDTYDGTASDSHIFVTECSHIDIRYCKFKGANDAGVYISADATQTKGRYCNVSDNYFEDCRYPIIAKRKFKHWRASDNDIYICEVGIASGEAGSLLPGQRMIVDGNTIIRALQAVNIRVSPNSIVSDNYIQDIGVDRDGATQPNARGLVIQGSRAGVFTGNTLCMVDGTTASSHIAIKLESRTVDGTTYHSTDNGFSDNTIDGIYKGIVEDDANQDRNTYIGNTMTGVTTEYTLAGSASYRLFRGAASLAVGNGLSFGNAANSNPNVLDWYEEGTWTPAPHGLTATGTPSYSGRFTRIGRMVHCLLRVTSSGGTTESAANTTYFDGLPYPPAQPTTCHAVKSDVTSFGVGLVLAAGGGQVYTPTWAANNNTVVTFSYEV